MREIQRTPVSSSNVATVGYDCDEMILEVEFRNGCVYQYLNVPEMVFQSLISAGSVGIYLAREVKPTYPYRRL